MSTLADELAIERTLLANERTLLAYIRTGLAIVAGGFAIAGFMDHASAPAIGAVLMTCGAVTIAVGVWRSVRVKRRLNRSVANA